MVLITGLGAVFPSPQREVSLITADNFSSFSISPFSPSPLVILSSISNILLVPILHGTHCPQDSSWIKCLKFFTFSYSSANFKNDISYSHTHGYLYKSNVINCSGQSKYLCPFAC